MDTTQKWDALPIVWEDETLIAIHKPSGLLVHPSEIDPHASQSVVDILQAQLNTNFFPVHRLDKPTSGVLLLAKTKDAASKIMLLFKEQRIHKTYLALVRGYIAKEGEIDYPLKPLKDKLSSKGQKGLAQSAITQYQSFKHYELPISTGRYPTSRFSLVKVYPVTGRQRQIRRHFKHIFHPIVGDTAHGDGKQNHLFREQFGCFRLMLHAQTLSFTHPYTGENICLEAALPNTFQLPLDAIAPFEVMVP